MFHFWTGNNVRYSVKQFADSGKRSSSHLYTIYDMLRGKPNVASFTARAICPQSRAGRAHAFLYLVRRCRSGQVRLPATELQRGFDDVMIMFCLRTLQEDDIYNLEHIEPFLHTNANFSIEFMALTL